MGLTRSSTGAGAANTGLILERIGREDRVIALAGNPNVGKSTLFNGLTGLRQHTGNWPGKTVTCAQGRCVHHGRDYVLVDLPGTYSLMAHSAEEEVARDFLCFGGAAGAVVVCDATCLERNLNLVLQTLELTPRTLVCVNLMDEANRKGVAVDLKGLSRRLGVPVVGTSAGRRDGLEEFLCILDEMVEAPYPPEPVVVKYPVQVEGEIDQLVPLLEETLAGVVPARWVALRLLEQDETLLDTLAETLGRDVRQDPAVAQVLRDMDLPAQRVTEEVVATLVETGRNIAGAVVTRTLPDENQRDRKLDQILTSRTTGVPVMLALLALVFWLTIAGANVPSALLADGLFWVQDRLTDWFQYMGAPDWLHGLLVLGIYRVLAWVVSVMLPPMAIFFPIFTLLEDFGYLPRVAFVLDHAFQKAKACGKQSLSMCMGFGCNAAGVVGCRIIDSPRERLIAILTNNFVPCNGRFPTLIAIITMFFVGVDGGVGRSWMAAVMLTGVIVLGVFMTFWVSHLLSATLLKGLPSAFTLELPPYRKPRLGEVVVRSVLDRTLFVLGRAVVVTIPAGAIIWVCANVFVGDMSILAHCTGFLDPFAWMIGLDGVILMAFILGFPANEIVIPIIIMSYLSTGTLTDISELSQLKTLLVDNGWTWLTALCTMLFSLMHWPCSTTCLTIGKETKSLKWTLISVALPTGIGLIVCLLVAGVTRGLGLI